MKLAYKDFSEYLRLRFPDFKVQKISVDAGFTCPNRDGSKGVGGCIYCNNQTFVPSYNDSIVPNNAIATLLNQGVRFFSRKYSNMRYLAYFQAYTNTYAPLETLKRLYEEALSVEGVVGLIIGTRPDCVPDATLDYLQTLSRQTFVMIEYGVESTLDRTLKLVNRCHTFAEAQDAIRRTAARNVPVGAHIILGLPGESREEMLLHADRLSELPLTSLKIHQLQIIKHTKLAEIYQKSDTGDGIALNNAIATVDDYIQLIRDFIMRLRDDIYIDRFVSQSPPDLVIAPKWGIKNYIFRNKIVNDE